MKKTLLLTSIAMLVAMTSCMRDEVVEVNKGHAINFRTAVETRGMEARHSSMDAIYVTALEDNADPYFSEVPFVLTGYDSYISTDTYYWPGQDRKLKFYAYAPNETKLGADVVITNQEKSLKNFVVEEKISDQVDFVFAENAGDNNEGLEEQSSVSLNFSHKLSRISIYGRTESEENVYKFAGVRIAGVYGKGDLNDLTSNAWTIDESAGKKAFVKELADDEIVVVDKGVGELELMGTLLNLNDYPVTDYAFMIPQTFKPWDPVNDPKNEQGGAYVAVKVQISTAYGTRVYPSEKDGEYAWVAIPLTGSSVVDESGATVEGLFEWKYGSSYNYTLNFTNGAGYVEPDINNPASGTPVLGDGATIKMTMTLPGMQEGVENMVVNPTMLGKWTATKFTLVQTYYKALVDSDNNIIYDANDNCQFELDENGARKVLWTKTTELEGANVIGPQIDNFANLTILDGMYMWVKNASGEEGKVRYYVNDDNYILMECYRWRGEAGSLDEGDYDPAPRIEYIEAASENAPGKATIIVESDGWNWSDSENGVDEPFIYEDKMTLMYDITYLTE